MKKDMHPETHVFFYCVRSIPNVTNDQFGALSM